ncbi:MAG: hypothetical protein B7Z55_04340 [Planctomycetales bacterium 12-60-4]|nr:MAG: hypothetical protein B7Z55_04340 [Planctomycetales bacterium 12-60-4]
MKVVATLCLLVGGMMCLVERPVSAQTRRGGAAVASSGLFQTMQATGKPALIIAGSTDCVYCREMSQELSSNPKLQPLVQQMFVAKIDVASRDWPILRDTFQFEETGIPAVFFVRADGKLLYSDAGKPFDMEGFLKELVGKSGKLLDAKTLNQMTRDARQLDLALKRKDYAKAAPLVKMHSGSGSFAAVALAYDQAGTQLVERATAAAQAAVEQLSNPNEQVQAAIELLELQAALTEYEPAHKVVGTMILKTQADEPSKQLLADAEQLREASRAESAKQWKAAVAAYSAAERGLATEAAKQFAVEHRQLLQPRVKD